MPLGGGYQRPLQNFTFAQLKQWLEKNFWWWKGKRVIEADDIKANTITANEIATGTITTAQLNFTPATSGNVIATINASAEGIKIDADNIAISGQTTFASGYDPTGKIAAGGAAADINAGVTTINGAKITTGTVVADTVRTNISLETVGYITVGTEFSTGYSPSFDVNSFFFDSSAASGLHLNTLFLTRQSVGNAAGSIQGIQSYLALTHPSGHIDLATAGICQSEFNTAAGTGNALRGIICGCGLGDNSSGTECVAEGAAGLFSTWRTGTGTFHNLYGIKIDPAPAGIATHYVPILIGNGRMHIMNEDFQQGGTDRGGYLYVDTNGQLRFRDYQGNDRAILMM